MKAAAGGETKALWFAYIVLFALVAALAAVLLGSKLRVSAMETVKWGAGTFIALMAFGFGVYRFFG